MTADQAAETVVEWEDSTPGGLRQCCETFRSDPHVPACNWLDHTRATIERKFPS